MQMKLITHFNKIAHIKFFQRDIQIKHNITTPWYFSFVMLWRAKTEPKIAEKATSNQ